MHKLWSFVCFHSAHKVAFLLVNLLQLVTSDMIVEGHSNLKVKEEGQATDQEIDVELGEGNEKIESRIDEVDEGVDGCKNSNDQEESTNVTLEDKNQIEEDYGLAILEATEKPCKTGTLGEEEEEEAQGKLRHLPPPGCPSMSSNDQEREVANCCAICLGTLEAKEAICWSSNPQCQHIFHSECALDWFQASGSKYLKQMRKQKACLSDDNFWKLNPVQQITSFPLSCPCCRQVFLIPPEDKDDNKGSNFEKFRSAQGSEHNESILTV